MKIKLAGTLGYCLGVRRAMETAFQRLSKRGEKVFSHGELIHNGPALELLALKGLRLWEGQREGSVIIRAHGLPPDRLAELKALEPGGLKVLDATCPRVRRVQILVAREAARGRLIIIWGKADHPEVIGLAGHAGGRARVVAGPEELAGLPEAENEARPSGPCPDEPIRPDGPGAAQKVMLVSQTTQELARWPEMVAAVQARWPEALIKNTICQATEERQRDLRRLAEEVEALVIVGGRGSGNTARLAEIGRQYGRPAFLVETAAELKPADFKGVGSVGVAAGASTSTWQIAQVLQALRAMARSRADFGFFWPRFLRVMVLSSLFAALGLAALPLALAALMNLAAPAPLFSFFFFQVAALHLFRDFYQSRNQGRGASQSQALRIDDPDRSAFFAKYGRPLSVFTLVCALMAALAAHLAGPPAPLILALSWLAALGHQFIPRPEGRPSLGRTLLGPILLGLGWGAAMVWSVSAQGSGAWLPSGLDPAAAVLAGGAAFGHIFSLAVMGDVLAVQGDRIFGRPTLPTVFGEKAARRLLTVFLGGWALWLSLGWALGLLPSLAGLLIISGPLYNLLLLRPLFQSRGAGLNPALFGFHFEALMYGQLLLTGLWTWLWTLR